MQTAIQLFEQISFNKSTHIELKDSLQFLRIAQKSVIL